MTNLIGLSINAAAGLAVVETGQDQVMELQLLSDPPGAIVFVGDQPIGKTPTYLDVHIGDPLDIRFEHSHHEPYRWTTEAFDDRHDSRLFAPLQ